jgi:hypothetical protein
MRKLILLAALCASSCTAFAINSAPKKKPNPNPGELSKTANDFFWEALHAGRYDALPEVFEALQRAYLTDPYDATSAAHLGFAHIWAVAERTRLDPVPATVTDHMVLAQTYFADAVEMTGDPRFLGFLAGTELANGVIHKDQRTLRQGYFRMRDAVNQYPEFNLFSRGYMGSGTEAESDRFKQGVEDMWSNIEFCFPGRVKRDNPDLTPLMKEETTTGPKRVCWNGWIAPHNHEGFYLNFGDMLTKAGDKKSARRMYENAKLSRTYATWPYKEVLESRLEHLDENVALFQKQPNDLPKERRMMFDSTFNCSGCHQAGEALPPRN